MSRLHTIVTSILAVTVLVLLALLVASCSAYRDVELVTAQPCDPGYTLKTVLGAPVCDNGQKSVPARAVLSPILAESQRYVVGQMKNTLEVYRFQYYSGIVLFVCVIGLVIAAIAFAYAQFSLVRQIAQARLAAYKERASKGADLDEIEKLFTPENVSLGASSVSVQTTNLGLAILVVSLAFFYLYLKTVYPITLESSLGLEKSFQAMGTIASPAPSATTAPPRAQAAHGSARPAPARRSPTVSR